MRDHQEAVHVDSHAPDPKVNAASQPQDKRQVLGGVVRAYPHSLSVAQRRLPRPVIGDAVERPANRRRPRILQRRPVREQHPGAGAARSFYGKTYRFRDQNRTILR